MNQKKQRNASHSLTWEKLIMVLIQNMCIKLWNIGYDIFFLTIIIIFIYIIKRINYIRFLIFYNHCLFRHLSQVLLKIENIVNILVNTLNIFYILCRNFPFWMCTLIYYSHLSKFVDDHLILQTTSLFILYVYMRLALYWLIH